MNIYVLLGLITAGVTVSSICYLLPKNIIIKLINKMYNNILTHRNDKKIYITIDDVPFGYTGEIIQTLNKYNTTATLFVIKPKSNNEKINQLLIDAVKSGHMLANHGTTNTMHLLKSTDILKKEIIECDKYIESIYEKANVSRPPKKFYRPGCGLFNQRLVDMCEELNHTLTIGSVYPHDPHITSPFINYHFITNKVQNGDIIIIHDRQPTIKLLEQLLPWINKRYQCDTL